MLGVAGGLEHPVEEGGEVLWAPHPDPTKLLPEGAEVEGSQGRWRREQDLLQVSWIR